MAHLLGCWYTVANMVGSDLQYLYMKDDEAFRQLTQRILDDQFEDAERQAVTDLGNMRHVYVKTILMHFESFENFMKTIGKLGLNEELFELLKTFEKTLRTVDRLYNDVSERSGKKDAKLLMQINTEGRFRCVHPKRVRGNTSRLTQGTLTLLVGGKDLSKEDAQDLRDRLFLEQDENAKDEKSIQLGVQVDAFHKKLEAVKQYNAVLVEFFLHGHRETGSTYCVYVNVADNTAAEIDAMREDRERSLARWEYNVGILRKSCPFLNYYTVHQLMLIVDGIQSRTLPPAMLHFVRQAETLNPKHLASSYSKLDEVEAGAGLSRQQSAVSFEGLKVIRRVGEFLTQTLRESPEVPRPFLPREPVADLQQGELNVVVAPSSGQVLATVLAIYAPLGRLPCAYEVLFCNEWTSLEEVLILLRRCFDRAQSKAVPARRYCLANADKLAHSMQLLIKSEFERLQTQVYLSSGILPFDLVILCSQSESVFVRRLPLIPPKTLAILFHSRFMTTHRGSWLFFSGGQFPPQWAGCPSTFCGCVDLETAGVLRKRMDA